MSEFKKYAIRFGLILAIAVPVMVFTQGANAARIIGYKVAMITIAVGLAELLWAAFFKPQYGKSEDMGFNDKLAVMLFRGVLYAAVILACALGL
jgi:hypothetical protein